jgi:hypothetical protein
MNEEILNEDKQIHRGSDYRDLASGRRRCAGGRTLPRTWDDAIARQAMRASLRGNASFYKWRSKYGGMDASLISQMKAMEDENRRLKRMYADLSMQADLLKEALGKK